MKKRYALPYTLPINEMVVMGDKRIGENLIFKVHIGQFSVMLCYSPKIKLQGDWREVGMPSASTVCVCVCGGGVVQSGSYLPSAGEDIRHTPGSTLP